MSSDANHLKVVIFDDDITPTLNSLENNIRKALNDDTSPEFEITKEFIEKKELLNTEDLDELLTFISSPKFIKLVVLNEEFHSLFEGKFKEELLSLVTQINSTLLSFNPFLQVFSDESRYELIKKTTRPVNPRELSEYDVIIMDILMGDSFDQSFEKLAEYLGEVHRLGNKPVIFLISSRDELEDLKTMFRKKAKISSLSFGIMRKSVDDLMSPTAEIKVKLAFEQMQNSKEASITLGNLTELFEKAITDSTSQALEILWSIDYPYLQQMHACVDNENVPFTDHFLTACNTALLAKLESNQPLIDSVNLLEKNLRSHSEKYCSFSKEAEVAVHNLEAAIHFTGKPHSGLVFDPNSFDKADDLGRRVIHIMPFGLVLIKPPVIKHTLPLYHEGAEVLINCTQQCDLSRNIINPGTNLVFIQAMLVRSPISSCYCVPLPTSVDDGNRWWLVIDEKKIHAKSFYEFLRQFNYANYRAVSQVRESVVRQIRDRLFQNMSRTEESVKTGHNDMFYVDLITFEKNQVIQNRFTVGNNAKKILLYKFPSGKDTTFHLLDQEHVEVINWLIEKSEHLRQQFETSSLETILKDQLPKMGKKTTISKVNFAIKSLPSYDAEKSKLVNQQTPVAVVFALAEPISIDKI